MKSDDTMKQLWERVEYWHQKTIVFVRINIGDKEATQVQRDIVAKHPLAVVEMHYPTPDPDKNPLGMDLQKGYFLYMYIAYKVVG